MLAPGPFPLPVSRPGSAARGGAQDYNSRRAPRGTLRADWLRAGFEQGAWRGRNSVGGGGGGAGVSPGGGLGGFGKG